MYILFVHSWEVNKWKYAPSSVFIGTIDFKGVIIWFSDMCMGFVWDDFFCSEYKINNVFFYI